MAPTGADSGDKAQRGGGLCHRFVLRLLVRTALLFDAVERDLAENNRDHLEGRPAAEPGGEEQPHKDQVERDEAAGARAGQRQEDQGAEEGHKNEVNQRDPHAAQFVRDHPAR